MPQTELAVTSAPSGQGLPLPDSETIRTRIKQLSSQTTLLRRLLRLVLRIENQQDPVANTSRVKINPELLNAI